MANMQHATRHACWDVPKSLTFGLSPSMLSCISCATVCSRILFSSACCRRSFISSRVNSSGCRVGDTATVTQERTANMCGEKKRKHIRHHNLGSGVLLRLGSSSTLWDCWRCYSSQLHAGSSKPAKTEGYFLNNIGPILSGDYSVLTQTL